MYGISNIKLIKVVWWLLSDIHVFIIVFKQLLKGNDIRGITGPTSFVLTDEKLLKATGWRTKTLKACGACNQFKKIIV